MVGYYQLTLRLVALEMSVDFGWILCSDIQRQSLPAFRWGRGRGVGGEREQGARSWWWWSLQT